MPKLALNGHPNFMKDGKIRISESEDNRLSYTDDGKLSAVGGTTFKGGTTGNGIAGTGGVGDTGLKGDITLNGVVDEEDATRILQVAARHGTGSSYQSQITDKQIWAGDFNSDTEINAEDAALVLQYVNAYGGSVKANQLSKPLKCDSSVSRIKQAITEPTIANDGVLMTNLVRSILSNPNLSTERNSVIITEHDVQIVEKVEKPDVPGQFVEQLVTAETESERLADQKTKLNPVTGLPMSKEEYTKMINDTLAKSTEGKSVELKSDDYDYSKWKDSSYKKSSSTLQANIVKITAKDLKTVGKSTVPIGWSSGTIVPQIDTSVLDIEIGTAYDGQKYYPTTTASGDSNYLYQSSDVDMYGSPSLGGTPLAQYQNGPLITVINSVVLAYDAAGISGQSGCYSQSKTVKITVNGNTFSARPDCSGLIQAVLTCMGYNASGLNSNGLVACTGIKYSNGTMSNDFEFIRNPATYQMQAGDFLARNGHAEIAGCIVDGKLYGWNFGGDAPIRRTITAAKNMVGTPLSETDLQNSFVKASATLGNSSYAILIRYKGRGGASSGGSTTPTQDTSSKGQSNFSNLSDADYVLLCNCVAHEAGSNSISIEEKAKVVEVIMNRVADGRFPNTIKGVITAPYQFTGSSTYASLGGYSSKVTNEVKEAVNYYFSNPSRFNHGYLYFYGDGKQNHFSVEWHGK